MVETAITYDRNTANNNLPLLPPAEEILMNKDILLKLIKARAALAKLDGIVQTLPNPLMLINTINIREAKDSSEIENIYTSTDELYEAMTTESKEPSGNVKEVLKYKEALYAGSKELEANKELNEKTILRIFGSIKDTSIGFRAPNVPIVIKKRGSTLTSGKTIYTPPRGKGIIEKLITNLLEFINDDTKYDYDPLLKMAITHYQFEAIHPFTDGNGRTGRILNILQLLSKGLLKYPVLYLSSYIIKNKDDYYFNLSGVTERQDWKTWILFMLEGVEQTSYYTIELIERINELHKSTQEYVKENIKNYNLEIIRLLFFQPYLRARNIVQDPLCGIKSIKTADKKLQELVKLGIIAKKSIGKEVVYINHSLIDTLK